MWSTYGDPFARLQQELEHMLSAFEGQQTGVFPPVNLFDAGEEVVLKAELPGVEPDKLDVEVRDDAVTLSGERHAGGTESRDAGFHRRERVQGQFRRVVRLPSRMDTESARAEYRHGVLTVRVPKAKEVRPRRVPVQAA
jgi:HSP20 family protein